MNVKSEMITFPSNGRTTPGFLAQPEGPGGYPGIVVLQEWWGLVDHIKDVAQRFAKQGFVALAPDLYHGQAASEPDEARKLAMAMDRKNAILECSAAAEYLNSLDQVSSKKSGVVGWCMGGALSLSTAAHNGAIGAAVAFYGRPLEADDVAKLNVPVLGIYGEDDQGIPVSIVKDFDKALDANNIPHEINIYPECPHAFFNDTRPQAFRPKEAQEAFEKSVSWFQKHLTS
ncbi:MAG: dienelactone hydrolase family protein [Chloroflexota bacterium]